jgi:hypothetical protein
MAQAATRESGAELPRFDDEHLHAKWRHLLRECFARFAVEGLFECAHHAVAGVVDQHIDAAESLQGGLDRGLCGAGRIDVECEGQVRDDIDAARGRM